MLAATCLDCVKHCTEHQAREADDHPSKRQIDAELVTDKQRDAVAAYDKRYARCEQQTNAPRWQMTGEYFTSRAFGR